MQIYGPVAQEAATEVVRYSAAELRTVIDYLRRPANSRNGTEPAADLPKR